MASCIWQSISLTFFWTTFFLLINQHDCMTLRQSGLAVFPVDSCPGNLSEVEAATLRLNCSDVKKFRDVYHCLPLSNLSLLVEFCYDEFSGLIDKGDCMVLENYNLNNHPCNHFTNGCPNVPYFPKEMFKFPACIQINKENRCYLAVPSCPNISFVEETTMAALDTIGNNTVLMNDFTPVVLGALVPFLLIGLVILIMWTWKRHRSHRRKGYKATPIGCEETSPLMAKQDNETNKSKDTPIELEESPLLIKNEVSSTNENKLTESKENPPLKTEEDNLTNDMQAYLEKKDFWERYQKYLEEGSVEVCPISQIIIVGEHGVGKTTLLYRLQGRSREEIEAIRSTRGVECHKKENSFIITRNQLKMNKKGISSLSADPEQISGFSTGTRIGENKSNERTILGEGQTQSALGNAEAETTETKNVEENLLRQFNSEETTKRKIPQIDDSSTHRDIEKEMRRKDDRDKQTDHESQSKHDVQRDHHIQTVDGSQSDHDSQRDHERELEHNREPDHNRQRDHDKQREPEDDTQSLIPWLKAELEERQGLMSRFGNKDDVVLDVLDFAGQGEYYASHQTYIRKDAIFILVINTSKDVNERTENNEVEENKGSFVTVDKNQFLCDRPGAAFTCWTPRDYFYYWLSTIRMHGGNSENIIFVGTHKDQRREDFDFDLLLDDTMNKKLLPKKYFKPVITDLCRYDEEIEKDITEIKNDICELIDERGRESRPAKWVKYLNIFDIIKTKCPILRIEELLEMVDHFDFEMSDTEVADMLDFFHSSGKIIFFNVDKLQEILIIDIQWFIDCFKHIISDRKHVEEDCRIVDSKEKEMLRYFREKGVLEISLYEKLLNQKRNIPVQYRRTLGEYQNKLGMMFYIRNYKIDESNIIGGWYVPSINTQEFKPSIEEYGSKDSSQILCFRFKDYLPHDFFGRIIVACLNSGHWRQYDLRLYKAGADLCYQHPNMVKNEQIYLFTSKRIVTVQVIQNRSGINGGTVRQEIVNTVKQLCHFYASSTDYEVGFLCRKEMGYNENSVDHFVSPGDQYCHGCSRICQKEWEDAESFWKDETHENHLISTGREMDPLQSTCEVYFHVLKRSTEMTDDSRPPEDVGREKNADSRWLDSLVEIGQKLKNLPENADDVDEKKKNELRNINGYLKEVSRELKNICRDLRKEIFFLWTQNIDNPKEIKDIPVVSLDISNENVQMGNNRALQAKTDVAIRHHLWFRKTFQENKYKVIYDSEEAKEKFEFRENKGGLVLTIKNFDSQDEGYYYVIVETENGYTVCRKFVVAEHLLQHMKTKTTTVRHARGIVVGCAGAGKTTLLYSLMGKSLDEINGIKSTRGLQVYEHIFSVKDGSLLATENPSRKPLIRVPKSSLTMMNESGNSGQQMMAETDNFPKKKDADDLSNEAVESKDEVEDITNLPSISVGKTNAKSSTSMASDAKHKTLDTEGSNIVVETLSLEVIKKILDAQENEISVSMIDFGGHFAYYACHQIYMRSNAFYILVVDMTKGFEEILSSEEVDRQGSVFSNWSYKEYIEFWLDFIKSFGGPEVPVLIVATHAEGRTDEDKEDFFERLWSSLPDEDISWLSMPFSEEDEEHDFAFGLLEMNKDKKSQKLQSLKNSIVSVVSHRLDTTIQVPSSWALLEHLLQNTGKPIISCDEIQELNKQLPEDYRLESTEEVPNFLTFFHDHGLLLYFKGKATHTHAILGIQWFSDAFSKLIADKTHIHKDCRRQHIKEWNHFNQTGELNSTLLEALWKDEKVNIPNKPSYKEYKNELMSYMERLRMLVSIGESDYNNSWYVPCMNKKPFKKDIIQTTSALSSILCFRFSSFAMFVFYRLIAYCMSSLKWNVASQKDGRCLFQTAAVFEYKNHTIVLGICHKDIQLQVMLEISNALDIETNVSNEIGNSIDKALEELTKTFSEKTNLSFQRGYKCQKIICDQNDMSFTPVEELCQLENKNIQCSCCPVGEKHEINVHETRRFWEQGMMSDSSTPVASGKDLGGRSRFAKLGMATNDVLNQAYRDILEWEVPPSLLFKKVKSSKIYKTLRQDQKDLLKKAKNSGYKFFDISLTYTLIRNVCSKIPKPTKRTWGGNSMPSAGEITVGDDIERIRLIRNRLTAHVSSASTPQTDFDNTWLMISDICQRLEAFTGKKYLDKLNGLQKLTLKKEDEDTIIEEVKMEYDREMLKSVVSDIKKLTNAAVFF